MPSRELLEPEPQADLRSADTLRMNAHFEGDSAPVRTGSAEFPILGSVFGGMYELRKPILWMSKQ